MCAFYSPFTDLQNVAIQRAHRSPPGPAVEGRRPRAIKVCFVDASISQRILFSASKTLRDNPHEGTDIYVTEVSAVVSL